jgi:rubrerythrin
VSEAEHWLRTRLSGAPPALLDAMAAALPSDAAPVPDTLARAGVALYQQVLHGRGGREDALPLLAADALFTHALQAQAETDPAGLADFAERVTTSPAFVALAAGLPSDDGAPASTRSTSFSDPPTPDGMPDPLTDALETARAAEKQQALFYRTLAAAAEERGDDALSERLNELHADEQHHVSRLSARILEMGAVLRPLSDALDAPAELDGWEAAGRRREEDEVRRYVTLLDTPQLDGVTRALLEEILQTERHHAEEMGGKWTSA